MLLLELNSHYFWVASEEVSGVAAPAESKVAAKEIAWRIADKLRSEDRIPYLEEIMAILMSEAAFRNAQARHDALNDILDKLGSEVNPRYAKVIAAISWTNIRAVATVPLEQRKAPALLEPISTREPDNKSLESDG